jgi:hypothetical protein
MNPQSIKRIHRVSALVLLIAVWFYLFFQINKQSPFVEANPFADDPYDAVGSIAIQVALIILTFACGLALWIVFRVMQIAPTASNLTPADAIDDLWSLVRVPVVKGGAIFPPAIVDFVECFNSERLFAKTQWIDPRKHPWRFAFMVGLLIGVLLLLGQLQEGLPPSLAIGLLVAGIFMSGEFSATLVGFALFGGYLGLRPDFKPKY